MEAAITAGAVLLCRLDHQPPGFAQRRAQFTDGVAHPRIGLDLGAQKFPHHLVGSAILVAGLEDAGVRVGEEVAGIGIDEEELLLDPERDGEIIHDGSPGLHLVNPNAAGRDERHRRPDPRC